MVRKQTLRISALAIVVLLFAGLSTASVYTVSSQSDWKKGTFNGTSADRKDNSGTLGLGYINNTDLTTPVWQFRMDRNIAGSGGTVYDYSGRGQDAETNGSVGTGASGIWGTNSFDFVEADGDRLPIKHSYNSSGVIKKMTVSIWVKQEGSSSSQQMIASYDRSEYWRLSADDCKNSNDGYIAFCWTDSAATTHDSNVSWGGSGSGWHLVTVTFDGDRTNEVKYYVDGELKRSVDQVASGTYMGSGTSRYGYVNAGSEASSFAGSINNGHHFIGKLDEAVYWDSNSLSGTQIETLYRFG
ncbi:MAG: LamG-like jellyroll fold domain-containing protein, partial [Candidatus Nanohaloarchaea archaeon]